MTVSESSAAFNHVMYCSSPTGASGISANDDTSSDATEADSRCSLQLEFEMLGRTRTRQRSSSGTTDTAALPLMGFARRRSSSACWRAMSLTRNGPLRSSRNSLSSRSRNILTALWRSRSPYRFMPRSSIMRHMRSSIGGHGHGCNGCSIMAASCAIWREAPLSISPSSTCSRPQRASFRWKARVSSSPNVGEQLTPSNDSCTEPRSTSNRNMKPNCRLAPLSSSASTRCSQKSSTHRSSAIVLSSGRL